MKNLSALAACIALAGCGGEPASDETAPARDLEITHEQGEDGSLEAAAMLPESLTLYPGATIDSKLDFSGSAAGKVVSLQSPDSVEKIRQFYAEQLEDAGIEPETMRLNDDFASLAVEGAQPNRGYMIVITRDGDISEIVITNMQ